MPTEIERRPFSLGPNEYAHLDFTRRLRERLAALDGGRVCELGGGANPSVELDFLREHRLQCLVVDVSQSELDKAPSGYATLVADVSSPSFAAGDHSEAYDLVFSRVLAEHVTDARQFHANVRALLRPGGVAMHFFPTLWWPPFVVNRVLPEALAERVLLMSQPWREKSGKTGKFPAYYQWCRGPTESQLSRLTSAGFTVEHCVAYFGEPTHTPGRALRKLNDVWTDYMMRNPNYLFTSYAAYSLRAE
jgi:2-polyprenyl-3-methyl-5-hydroxy-6-metoxy-1,4-benzoquinol methylase